MWYHPRSRRVEDAVDAATDALPGVYALARRGDVAPDADVFSAAKETPDVSGAALASDADSALAFDFAELGLAYRFVPPRRRGDPSLFLDFRPARRWVREECRRASAAAAAARRGDGDKTAGCEVMNAFAYTCGVGVAAAAGGATRVLNTDHSETYLGIGALNASMNGFGYGFEEGEDDDPATAKAKRASGLTSDDGEGRRFETHCEDFYPAVRVRAGLPRLRALAARD